MAIFKRDVLLHCGGIMPTCDIRYVIDGKGITGIGVSRPWSTNRCDNNIGAAYGSFRACWKSVITAIYLIEALIQESEYKVRLIKRHLIPILRCWNFVDAD